jgi:outer membrane protein
MQNNRGQFRACKSIFVVIIAVLSFLDRAYSLDLLETYELALQNDPQVHEAQETRNALLEAKPQSLAKLLPSLAIVGSLNGNHYETTSTFTQLQLGSQYFWDSSVFLKLSQPIYHNDYWVQLSQSENQIAQAEAEYSAEQQNLLIRTAKAYFGVLVAEDNLEVAQSEKSTVEHQLKEMKKRLAVGSAAITDLQEAQAGFDQATAGEIEAQRKLRAAKTELTEIIGNANIQLNGLVGELALEMPHPNNLQDWLNFAQQNNLLILAATNRAESARKNIEIQFSGHLPTFDLVANVGTVDTDRPAGLIANSQTIGLQMNMPLYLGGSVDSKVRQAEHQFEAAKQNLEKQRRTAERQVEDAYQGIELTISQINALDSARRSTKVTVEGTEKGVRVGTRTMADLLTANRNLSKAQRDYSQARYDYILNSFLLKQAAGALTRVDLEAANSLLK